ncbi:MAG: type II secretion system protein [Rickettsiales bacterium]
MKKSPTQEKQGLLGFTLIELSIVLVIIGLIVGGVLVGQDLIKAAEVRATIGQYEKYNAAINTFRTKYNGMPGDLVAAQAAAFGIYQGSGTTGLGDGNGLITDTAATNINAPVGETLIFWRHLTDANLTDGSFGTALTASTAQAAAGSNAPGDFVPGTKIGRGTYWLAGSSAGLNYYGLVGLSAITGGAAATATYVDTFALTPIESFNIDSKLDDGKPNTGIVQARGTAFSTTVDGTFGTLSSTNAATNDASTPAAGDCTTTGASTESSATYARGSTPGNSPACNLRMRFN